MRIGVFHGRRYYLRNFRTALDELLARGHELVLATPETKDRQPGTQKWLRDRDRVSVRLYPNRRADGLDRAVDVLRATRDAARFELPQLRDDYANRRRALQKLARAVGVESGRAQPEDVLPLLPDAFELARVEALVPPIAPLVDFIRAQRLDVLLAISRVNFGAPEADVIQAARTVGVPSALAVYSWDNLSSKALIHRHPDRLLVWNEIQVREAAELHGLAAGVAVATGAPRFDPFFALRPSAGRETLLAGLGLDPDRATILYLGSSGFVSKREPEFFEAWLSALRAHPDELLAGANIVVRPHPGAIDEPAWAGWRPSGERVVRPVVDKRAQNLFDQLSLADAVVALNTTAELEAAIADRPVLTVDAGALAPGQEGSGHFRYLLEEQGGFVEHSETLEEHVGRLARALESDPQRGARRAFLERFVRPRGLDVPAGPVLAEAIEQLASA
ncbi:MAG TPA: hypothetical protein VH816_00815 [Gaiellaceae bacterium]|jgi:hypothetical protein